VEIAGENNLPTKRVNKKVNIVAKANFGFGDVNACLIISKYNN
jgi:3-oxoacyl-(acyl-carrier-protein) synthase